MRLSEPALFFNLVILGAAAAFSLYVGFRPEWFGTDTSRYVELYSFVIQNEETRISEPLFMWLIKASTVFSKSHSLFFVLTSFLSLFVLIIFYRKLSEMEFGAPSLNRYWVFVFFCIAFTFVSPFFWNAQSNVIRSGLSIPFLLLATLNIQKKLYLRSVLFGLFAVALHFTAVVYIFFLPLLILKERTLIALYVGASLSYVTALGEVAFGSVLPFLSGINSDFLSYYMRYATMEGSYESGVRRDFALFTMAFALIAVISRFRGASSYLLKSYLVMSFPFMIVGFISFSDRLLLPAWFLIPPILALSFVQTLSSNYPTLWISTFGAFLGVSIGLLMHGWSVPGSY